MEILYSSAALYASIKRVLEDPEEGDRRVVLVAYIGGQAEMYLPDVEGLEIVCCLKPGATDALTLNRLRARNAQIFKSKDLHMKVYWSSSRGCVICSANVSGNAFSGSSQKEAGAFFSPNVVDVEKLLAYAQPKPITGTDLKRLAHLAGKPPHSTARLSDDHPPGFLEWYGFFGREEWKLGWWIKENLKVAANAKQKALRQYNIDEPEDAISIKEGQVREADWLLKFQFPNLNGISWFFAEWVGGVDASDSGAYLEEYPFQAVQFRPSKSCPRPPFKIDATFRRAFKRAVHVFGIDKIEEIDSSDSLAPPARFLALLANEMRK